MTTCREKGDASKTRDFLPVEKQYLVTRGVPCLRRAISLAYTDEDEERMLSFADSDTPGGDGDEWVETHAGRKSKSGGDHADIQEIPDIDGQGDDDDVAGRMGGLSLGQDKEPEIIDIDDIPDMEEDDLEDGDEATAAPKHAASKNIVSEPRSASLLIAFCAIDCAQGAFLAQWKPRKTI